jgi:hypothetical protein
MKNGPYRVVDLSPGRRIWLNTLDISWNPHCIYGLLEVDVTVARRFMAEHKTLTGESLSFTGFLAYCLARAVDEDRSVQAYLKGRKQLVLFDDVDVGMMVENRRDEKQVLSWVMSFAVPIEKHFGKSTTKFEMYNQRLCRPIGACPPGIAR